MASEGTKKYEKAFDIILSSVDETKVDALTPELASAFSLEADAAGQILKSAPIVFLHGMSKSDVRHIKKHLVELSRNGADFTITTQAAVDLPKVVWAHKPKFGEAASGETISELRFDLGRNAFVCPGCGETFLFRRVGNLAHKLTAATAAPALKEEPVAPAAKPVAPTPSLPAPAHAKAAGKSAPAPKVEEEALEAVVPLESIEMLEKGGVDEVEEEPEAATPPPPALVRKGGKSAPPPKAAKHEEEEEAAEELEPDMEVAADDLSEDMDLGADKEEEAEEIAEIEEVEEAEEMEEIEEVEEEEEAAEEEEEEAPARPAPGKGRGAGASRGATAKPAAKPSYAPAKKAEEKEEEEEEAGEDGGEGGDDVQFSVFLSRIPTPDKQSAAAKLISDMRGVSMAEAKELASRMVIPVLKDVSKDEAEKCLERFKKIKVSGRMTKKK